MSLFFVFYPLSFLALLMHSELWESVVFWCFYTLFVLKYLHISKIYCTFAVDFESAASNAANRGWI